MYGHLANVYAAVQAEQQLVDARATKLGPHFAEAERQAEISRSRELAAASTSQLPLDPELALLLAIEGAETEVTPEAESALREALLRSNHLQTFEGHQDPIPDASVSADGSRVLTTSFWLPRFVPQGVDGAGI